MNNTIHDVYAVNTHFHIDTSKHWTLLTWLYRCFSCLCNELYVTEFHLVHLCLPSKIIGIDTGNRPNWIYQYYKKYWQYQYKYIFSNSITEIGSLLAMLSIEL